MLSTRVYITYKCCLQECISPSSAVYKSVYHFQMLFKRVHITFKCCIQECISPSSAIYKSAYYLQVLSTRVYITFKCCLQECISPSSAFCMGAHYFQVQCCLQECIIITFMCCLQECIIIIFMCCLQEYIIISHSSVSYRSILITSKCCRPECTCHFQVLSTRVYLTLLSAFYKSTHTHTHTHTHISFLKCCLQEYISLSSAVDQSVKVLSIKVHMSAGVHHFLVLATRVCITFKRSLQKHINHFQVL